MTHQKIPYGSKEHTKILDEIYWRFSFSTKEMAKNHKRWQENEEKHQFYIKESDVDRVQSARSKARDEPDFVTIVIPYDYAMVMAAHTYLSTVFLSRDPVLQFAGRHGEGQDQVLAVESIQAYQTQVGGHLPTYYVWELDSLRYGFGVAGAYWDDETIVQTTIEERQREVNGIKLIGEYEKVKKTREIPGYEGSKLYNVRPWDFRPDPRVPLAHFQKGEFVGRLTDLSWNDILRGERDGLYFNTEELKKRRATEDFGSKDRGYERGDGIELPDTDGDYPAGKTNAPDFFRVLEMYVDLVPKDWGLGKSEYPEKWVFTVVNPDNHGIIIGCQPLGELHGKYPFGLIEYEVDGYNLANRSMYDVLGSLQGTLNWLLNTHFYNIRQSLNDMIVFDPSRIVMDDMLRPGPGKMVRSKPEAMGNDVRTAVHQFQVRDVTQQHLQDSDRVMGMMQRVVGVTDNIMGMMQNGGRRSATEVRQTNTFGITRLKSVAEYQSACGWAPLSQLLVQMTQNNMSRERQYRVAGQVRGIQQFVSVTPEQISGAFDFVPVDGTMPLDRQAMVGLWTQLLGQLRQIPQVAQQYDFASIFGWIAQLAGIRNIDNFRIEVAPQGVHPEEMGARPAPGQEGAPSTAQSSLSPEDLSNARSGARTADSGPMV